ncbi:hypothetical protein DRP05_08825 [Archaeoglobales archaeon]|nr:MAG: hypothetical protein DRP05_08825 [Archaeoglobales archaeon]
MESNSFNLFKFFIHKFKNLNLFYKLDCQNNEFLKNEFSENINKFQKYWKKFIKSDIFLTLEQA